MNETKPKEKYEKYGWTKLFTFFIIFSFFMYLISGIDEHPPPSPEKLVIYKGIIKRFIKETGKYGSYGL